MSVHRTLAVSKCLHDQNNITPVLSNAITNNMFDFPQKTIIASFYGADDLLAEVLFVKKKNDILVVM